MKLIKTIDMEDENTIHEQLAEIKRLKSELSQAREELKKHEWVSVKERLPEDKNQLCVFVHFHQDTSIESYVAKFSDIEYFRAFQLKNSYTHWKPINLPEPPTKSTT
jgi:hypothetical protein